MQLLRLLKAAAYLPLQNLDGIRDANKIYDPFAQQVGVTLLFLKPEAWTLGTWIPSGYHCMRPALPVVSPC